MHYSDVTKKRTGYYLKTNEVKNIKIDTTYIANKQHADTIYTIYYNSK